MNKLFNFSAYKAIIEAQAQVTKGLWNQEFMCKINFGQSIVNCVESISRKIEDHKTFKIRAIKQISQYKHFYQFCFFEFLRFATSCTINKNSDNLIFIIFFLTQIILVPSPRENLGKTQRKPRENPGKTSGKPRENPKISGSTISYHLGFTTE